MARYRCLDCGWIYDEAEGIPERNILAGTKWEELPNDFRCTKCGVVKGDTAMWRKIE